MREILGKFQAKGRPVLEFGAYTDVQGSTLAHAGSNVCGSFRSVISAVKSGSS